MRLPLFIGLAALAALAGAGAAAPVAIELPSEFMPYPDLPGASAEAMNANCLACHSAEMVLTQPRLSSAEWVAEVAKMRAVYKAPIDAGDDAAIIAWLTAMSARLPKQAG